MRIPHMYWSTSSPSKRATLLQHEEIKINFIEQKLVYQDAPWLIVLESSYNYPSQNSLCFSCDWNCWHFPATTKISSLFISCLSKKLHLIHTSKQWITHYFVAIVLLTKPSSMNCQINMVVQTLSRQTHLQTGHFQLPLSQFNLKYDSKSKH